MNVYTRCRSASPAFQVFPRTTVGSSHWSLWKKLPLVLPISLYEKDYCWFFPSVFM